MQRLGRRLCGGVAQWRGPLTTPRSISRRLLRQRRPVARRRSSRRVSRARGLRADAVALVARPAVRAGGRAVRASLFVARGAPAALLRRCTSVCRATLSAAGFVRAPPARCTRSRCSPRRCSGRCMLSARQLRDEVIERDRGTMMVPLMSTRRRREVLRTTPTDRCTPGRPFGPSPVG